MTPAGTKRVIVLMTALALGMAGLVTLRVAQQTMSQEKKTAPEHTNRLIKEKSPYLLQHAHNPVDWYPC